MTFAEAAQMTEAEARDYLERIRWPNGVVCPKCGSTGKMYKLEGDAHRDGLYKCSDCRKQFTVTVGTVMHRTKIPLRKWVLAFHIICASKKGVSALQLQRMLDLGSYRTAWHMAHRIRLAMREEPLAGLLKGDVEADETYVGGRPRYKGTGKTGRGTDKTPVLALVERNGRVRAKKVERVNADELKGAIREHVDRTSAIHTDEWAAYKGIGEDYDGGHHVVRHAAGEYVAGEASTNTAESYFALLKRSVHGAYHHVSKKHLGRYLDHQCFLWNSRHLTDGERTATAIRGADGKRLTYQTPRDL